MLGEKGRNTAIFLQDDRRFRNFIMAWQKEGTDRGLLPATTPAGPGWQ